MRIVPLALLLTASLAGAQGTQSSTTYVQLILDASGSMFSRLEGGSTRISVAKDVLTNFISQLPGDPNLNVGLRVYGASTGASDATACQDSKLVLPMRGLDRPALTSTVTTTRPRGATPIVYSLQQAALDFPQDSSRKVIVLVTDGQESCGGNLQAALAAFKERGIEVDIRVIGIDLAASAQRTFSGLKFENARSAADLAGALGRATQDVAKPVETRLPVTVTLTSNGQPVTSGATVVFANTVNATDRTNFTSGPSGYGADLLAGTYTATVTSTANGTQTFANLAVAPGSPNRFTFEIGRVGEAKLTVAPAEPVAGGKVQVAFTEGAAGDRNYITIARRADADSVRSDFAVVRGTSGNAELTLPDVEGELEARYVVVNPDGTERVIGRSAPFTPKRVVARLDAPAEAIAGSLVKVGWTGPNNERDYVTIVQKGAPEGTYTRYRYTREANPLELLMPSEPGEYELRYSSDDSNRTLASKTITLRAAQYALEVPESAIGGSTVSIRWTGPNNPSDYITIVPKGAAEGAYLAYRYTSEGNPLTMTAPVAPGEYEVRYSSDASRRTLASRPLTVRGAQYSLEAPGTAIAGSELSVQWTGPNNPRDYITVVKKGAPVGSYLDYAYTREGNPVSLKVPDEAGEYEVRYSTEGASPNPTLFSVPLTVKR